VGIIKLELLGGARTEAEFEKLKNRLDAFDMIEMNDAFWNDASNIAFKLKRLGLTIPSVDIVIATAALREKSILIHADAHFNLIAQHIDLNVESYVEKL